MFRFNAVLLFMALVAVVYSPPGHAQGRESGRVLFLSMVECCPDAAWIEGEGALEEELQTLDVDLTVLSVQVPVFRNTEQIFTEYAVQYSADIVVRVTREPPKNWRADILTRGTAGETTFRQMHFITRSSEDVLATVTLRVIEAVRAGIIIVPTAPPPPVAEVEEEPEEEPRIGRLGLGIGVGVAGSPGGMSPGSTLDWSLSVRPIPSLLLEADGMWMFYSKDLRRDGSRTSFDELAFRGFLYWEFNPKGRVHPALGPGAGAFVFRTEGVSSQTDDGISDRDTVAYLGLGTRIRFDISHPFGLVLAAKAGMLIPQVQVFFDGQSVAEHGWPLLEASVLLEFRFL